MLVYATLNVRSWAVLMLRLAPICWVFGDCPGRSSKPSPGTIIHPPATLLSFLRWPPCMPEACTTRNGIPPDCRILLCSIFRFSRCWAWPNGNRIGNRLVKPWTIVERSMSEKIMFVDDEPAALDGYRRLLHKTFTVETAVGAPQALQTI